MERKGPPISLGEFRRRFGNTTHPENRLTPLQQIARVQRDAQQLVRKAEERYSGIDEDAYSSRDEAWKLLTFLGAFTRKIEKATPGSAVDLTQKVVDDGYDDEEAAAARDSGLDYITAADRAETEYAFHLHVVGKFLPRLEKAGVTIKVGFRRIPPDLLPTDPDTEPEEG